jgi:uncharacterized protein (DUF924 family)
MRGRSSISNAIEPRDIIAFWREAGEPRWFAKDAAFDTAIRERFEPLHWQASRGELTLWEKDAAGALALLLLTDQFPRNLYRGSAHAFASDAMALAIAARALTHGFDRTTEPALRPFFYLPFEHHEDAASQGRAVILFEQHARETGDTKGLDYARLHAGLIARFGRFPHRNAVLGRESTGEETAYIEQGGFAG